MPVYHIDLICQVCGAPWTSTMEGTDEGDALFRVIAEAGRSRCQLCTTKGQFELKRSRPAEGESA